jgi:hypothetical protein
MISGESGVIENALLRPPEDALQAHRKTERTPRTARSVVATAKKTRIQLGRVRRHVSTKWPSFVAALVVSVAGVAAGGTSPAAARNITFSGFSWTVASGVMDDPAASRFSTETRSVWVDGAGRLHLRLRRVGAVWYSAEIACTRPLGYGTYAIDLDTDVGALDPNVVVGFFTWSDDDAFANREIDVEFSRWGDPAAADAQYAVQPYARRGHLIRFNVPSGKARSHFTFSWQPATVVFDGYARGVVDNGVPPPGNARVHLNIWLAGGHTPIDGREAEVIVEKFAFRPMETGE